MNKIIKRALINSLGTVAYVVLVVSLISLLGRFPEAEDKFIVPIAMLLLLICSAAITGFLVFGKPAMLYVDGKKKEALSLIGYTLGILVITTVILFVILITV